MWNVDFLVEIFLNKVSGTIFLKSRTRSQSLASPGLLRSLRSIEGFVSWTRYTRRAWSDPASVDSSSLDGSRGVRKFGRRSSVSADGGV